VPNGINRCYFWFMAGITVAATDTNRSFPGET